MKKQFKIIELDDRQVLIAKDYAEDETKSMLRVIFFTADELKINLKFTFNEESDRDKAFDNADTDTEYAKSIVNKISKSIEDYYDEEDDE